MYKGWITFWSIPVALFIFLCNEEALPDIRKFIAEAKKEIDDVTPPEWQWSCGNTKGIQVGDKILFQRTGKKPHGFFASGIAVAADEQYQLRLAEEKYISFSEAYITDNYGSSYMILVEIHTVVDYDHPLKKSQIESIPEFRDISLHFQRGGCEIKPDYLAKMLYSEWEKHSMETARKGFGRRLVDVICKVAHETAEEGEYQKAIEVLNEALTIDSEYVKAKNGIKKYESILNKQSKVTPADDIVQENTSVADNDIVGDNVDLTPESNTEIQSKAFLGSPENNHKVEVEAINFVTKTYESEGWVVTSVERDKVGFDLICKRGNERLDVEVKGLSGNRPQFILTANELKQSKENALFVLCVVTSALVEPFLQRWTGVEMLQNFNFEPLAYKAKLKTV